MKLKYKIIKLKISCNYSKGTKNILKYDGGKTVFKSTVLYPWSNRKLSFEEKMIYKPSNKNYILEC